MASVDVQVRGVNVLIPLKQRVAMTYTRAELMAERATDDELVAVVRRRLTGVSLIGLDGLGIDERALLANLERRASRSLAVVTTHVWRDRADGAA